MRCTFLEVAGSRRPVIWPVGTVAHINPFRLELRGGLTVYDGDYLEGGGGNERSATLNVDSGRCLTGEEVVVFNPHGSLTVKEGPPTAAVPPPMVFTRAGGELGPADAVAGIVRYRDSSGCIELLVGKIAYTPVWPEGTVAFRQPFRLVLPDGARIDEGDRISGLGRYPGASGTRSGIGLPGRCVNDAVVVFGQDSRLRADGA